ncbi:hypothetical protein ACFVAD_16470 [Sutcliffiella sp. NPDC057660]|uniref:hypothetical protein n=1 Tax=Sutcliffiella sp. NPDC057660 TaxID=3346199 RepID=UPI00368DF0C0
MNKAELDVPVALIFFTRPETLKEVFKKVKKARPSKLFLIQDGERKGNEFDYAKIKQCREIVNDIDWECEIYRNYSDVNLGCGKRPKTGISWVFEYVDRAIILEDDCIPADSFFPFCKEMLEKYKDDSRIGIISGLNYFKEYDFGGYSYGFVKTGAIWGWATWKDRWQKYEYDLKKIDETYVRNNVLLDITPKYAANRRIRTWENARKELEGNNVTSYWDYQWGFTRHVNSWLSIVPKYNQITNVGIGTGSTHSGNNIKLLPKKIANFFFMDVKELELPLKHPDFVLPNRQYDANYYKIIYPNIFHGLLRKISSKVKKFYYK